LGRAVQQHEAGFVSVRTVLESPILKCEAIMYRPYSDGLRNCSTKQISNIIGIRRKRWDDINDLNEKCSSSVLSRFAATVVGVTTMAVVAYTVSKVDGFSASHLHHHYRIQRCVAAKISSKDSRLGIPSQYGHPPLLFGRRMPSLSITTTSTKLFLSTQGNNSSDQSEWKAVLLALQLYKAAYGDLKVPRLFVVPSMAPWPGTSTQKRRLFSSCVTTVIGQNRLAVSFL
jgi:hypothetical protein